MNGPPEIEGRSLREDPIVVDVGARSSSSEMRPATLFARIHLDAAKESRPSKAS